MPIKFACPSCQKQLKVKDDLAGKKAACPSCKKVLLIPQASTVPAGTAPTGTTSELKQEELEDIATSLLNEKKEEEPQATGFVETTCPYCDTAVKLPDTLAGKQAPCPECRRIIKVPQLAPTKKKNWQEVATTGLSLVKRDEEHLEDSWGSKDATRVSTDALYEAGAIKEVRPPVTGAQWVMRAVWLAMGLAVLYGGYVVISRLLEGNLQKQVADKLQEIQPNVPATLLPEFRRLWGEYHLELARRTPPGEGEESRKQGQIQIGQAIETLPAIPDELEKVAVCRALLSAMRTGGFGPEQMGVVLGKMHADPVRRGILRELIRAGLSEQSAETLSKVVEELSALVRTEQNPTELAAGYGILGQELLSLNRALAAQAAEQGKAVARGNFVQPLAALLEALGQNLEAEPPNNEARDMVRIEGAARAGRYAEAVQKLTENNTLTNLERTRVLLMLAEVAGPKNKAEMEKLLTQAAQLVPKDNAWERARLVELTLATGERALAETRAGQLLGEGAKGRVQARALQSRLAQGSERADPEQVNTVAAGPARAVAVHAVAYHNARLDPKEVYEWAQTQGEYVPFALLGVLRGMAEAVN